MKTARFPARVLHIGKPVHTVLAPVVFANPWGSKQHRDVPFQKFWAHKEVLLVYLELMNPEVAFPASLQDRSGNSGVLS